MIPFGSFVGRTMWTTGVGDGGLAVLSSALAWGSTLEQTVVEENLTVSLAGWTGGVVTAGAPDHEGGTTGFYLTDTAATSNRAGFQASAAGFLTGARYTYQYYTRVDPAASAPYRWGNQYVYLQTPGLKISDVFIATPAAPDDGRVKFFNPYDIARVDVLKIDDEWTRVRVRDTTAQLFTVITSASYAQSGAPIGQFTRPTITRRSVSAQTNLATGSAAVISQGTAASRPEVDDDEWIDGNEVVWTDGHDGKLSVSVIPALLSGASKTWSFGALLDFRKHWKFSASSTSTGPVFRLTGATASLSINQTATGIEVVKTDDASSTTTATMPLTWIEGFAHALTLTCSGSTVQLYINGTALGAPQALGVGAATFTAAEVYGASRVAMGEWAVWDYELSADEVRLQASALANRRGTSTGPLPLWWGVGQSNGDVTGPSPWELPLTDQFPPNGRKSLFTHKRFDSTERNLKTWGKPRPRAYTYEPNDVQFDPAPNRADFTIALGFGATRPRFALMSYAKGGTPIAEFLSTGSEWAAQTAFWDARIAELDAAGVVWVAAGLVNVHGESDASQLATAQTFSTKLEQLRADIEAEYSVSLPIVAVPRLHVDIDPVSSPHSATLRANVEAWEVADPASRWLINNDDLSLKVDNIHYTNTTTIEIGRRLGAPSNRVKDI